MAQTNLKPRLQQLVDLLPKHNWIVSRAAVEVGYSESYATRRLPKRLSQNVSFCVAVEAKQREFTEATRWDEAKWREECVGQYERAKATQDRPTICKLLKLLGDSVGAFEKDDSPNANHAPTIVIHMPEGIEQPDQPERPALRLHDASRGKNEG